MLALVLTALALVALYLYGTRSYGYWAQRGVKHDRPLPFFGNFLSLYLLRTSFVQLCSDLYRRHPNERVVGFYRASYPQLLVRDPEIIKRVLITDFAHFHPRSIHPNKTAIEPLMKNLFFADGDLWKLLRQRMTPAFTSGKLKAMFPLVVERAERLQRQAIDAPPGGRLLDARELMARYTTDFIGACGFGLDADSLGDERSAFRKLGAKIFRFGTAAAVRQMLKEMLPGRCEHLKVLGHVEKDVVGILKYVLTERNYEPSGRNDFVDLLLECKKKGRMVGESIERFKADGSPEEVSMELDEMLMAAQVFIFFAAGFETSSSATSFTLHQLAYHPEVQRRVQEEIDTVLSKHDDKLCYDAVKEMKYLHCAFKEGMRMFPSLGFLVRRCVRNYTLPELDLQIDNRVAVIIPVQALQNDPQYFEEPHRFRPERFLSELRPGLKHVYLPFGDGPRACIGERLGLMQSLAGLAAVLSRYSVEPSAETVRHPKVSPGSGVVQSIKGGLPLLFRLRTK